MPDEPPRPFKMPLWPLPPLVVVAFTAIALATQDTPYLIAELVLIALALLAWADPRCGRRPRHKPVEAADLEPTS